MTNLFYVFDAIGFVFLIWQTLLNWVKATCGFCLLGNKTLTLHNKRGLWKGGNGLSARITHVQNTHNATRYQWSKWNYPPQQKPYVFDNQWTVKYCTMLVAPQKTANSQWVSGLSFIHTPPSHHISHHTHHNLLNYCVLCVLRNTHIYNTDIAMYWLSVSNLLSFIIIRSHSTYPSAPRRVNFNRL